MAKFPQLQRATLSNGLKIILAERQSVPLINFNLLVDAGYAADQFAAPGTAALALDMMDEGTKTRTALQINEELAMLGAELNTGSDLDVSTISLSTLKANLDKALTLYADVILNPAFPQTDFERLQKQQLAAIKREKTNPSQMALRVLPKFVYGANHAYGNSFTGSGTEESVSKLTRDDLVKFHAAWFKPNQATLVVVGAATMDKIQPKLEKLFKNWAPGAVPQKNIGTVEHQPNPTIYLMDKPGAVQSAIFAAHVAPPKSDPNDIAIETMNIILGGMFTSRINMNLREGKHWSYGSRSFLVGARGQRPFMVNAPVQTDKTKESMIEILKELNEMAGARPATEDELSKAQKNRTLRLPGSWETLNAVGNSINDIVRYGLPDNYYETYPAKIAALNLNDMASAAKQVIHPQNLVWVVVGDRAKIEAGIRELNFGEIRYIDTNGNLIN